DRIPVDPAIALRTPAGTGRLPRILNDAALNRVLGDDTDPTNSTDPSDDERGRAARLAGDAVVELLYGSGLRIGELCGLRRSDLALPGAVVTVWGKGSKQRRVPLSESSIDAIQAWLEHGRSMLATTETDADIVFV